MNNNELAAKLEELLIENRGKDAEISRLTAAIEAAPCDENCNTVIHNPMRGFFKGCDCWKAAALKEFA